MPDRSSNRRFPVDAGEVCPRLVSILLFALLPLHLAALPTPSERPARGYQPRDCGFDMDDDGIVGEPEDCRVCDGTTTDPDNDMVDEDLFYVDCQNGTDNSTCGAPGSPCRTIEYAWGTRADGPADGAEDIICFRGTCTPPESFSPPRIPNKRLNLPGCPGVEEDTDLFYERPPEGSQGRAWRYPKNPTMLVGWDSDGDHVYPPEDPNDLAVLTGITRRRAFRLDAGTSYLEMAHFTARGYGRAFQDNDTGFLRWGPNPGCIAYQHFHDLELLSINQDRDTTSGNALANLFPTTAVPKWILFENLEVLDNGQWFVRGSGYDDKETDEPEMGPFRFTNITRTAHSCDFSDCGPGAGSTVFKMWGYLAEVEILDSIWDANVDAWEPKAAGGPSGSSFVNPAQCTQDWLIRNNEVTDYKNPVTIEGYSPGFCNGDTGEQPARPVTGIVIDGNWFWNTYEPWDNGDVGVRIQNPGFVRGAHVGRVDITNNVFASSTGWEAAVWIRAGNYVESAPDARILVAHNTFYGDINRHAALVIGDVEGIDAPKPLQNIEVHHNIFAGLEGNDIRILKTYEPLSFERRHNTFNQDCPPIFVDPARGDFHLSSRDTCARASGSVPEPGVLLDFDGDPRVALGALDIGADEISAAIFADGFESGAATAWSLSSP